MRERAKRQVLAVLVALVGLVAGCGEDSPNEPEPEVLNPVAITRAERGIGVFPGDETTVRAADWVPVAEAARYLVVRSQLVDELLVSREGESAVSAATFGARVASIRANIEAVQSFDELVLVLDLFRLSDGSRSGTPAPYLCTWDKNERDPERYGCWRQDYRDAVLAQVAAAARDEQPAYFVFGAELERYLAMPGGASDYANLVTLYREAYAAIKEASPQTQVGVGIDWVRFQLDLVPLERLDASDLGELASLPEGVTELDCAALPSELAEIAAPLCVDKAFARYVEPFLRYLDPVQPTPVEGEELPPAYVRTADVLALAAQPRQNDFGDVPANCPEDFFAPLRSWSKDYPVVYYQVNWQLGSAVGFNKQAEWYDVLVARNLGVQVELVAWRLLKDLLDADCGKLTTDLGAPASICLSGVWSASTAPKEVADVFFTDVLPPD